MIFYESWKFWLVLTINNKNFSRIFLCKDLCRRQTMLTIAIHTFFTAEDFITE